MLGRGDDCVVRSLEKGKRLTLPSRSRRKHEHFAIVDLIFRKDIRTGFRIYLNFRVRKARLDRPDGLDFVGNSDKEYFLSHCATCPSAGPQGTDLPAFCHSSVYMDLWFWRTAPPTLIRQSCRTLQRRRAPL